MNKLKTLSIVFLILLLGASCTEEISDNLKNTDQSATATNATKAIGNKFSLSQKMDENLSFYLHSAASRSAPCELEASGTNFDSTNYEKDDSKDVVDCILEVEELDLYMEGLTYELKVDEYLCEYIQYKPFKFFQFPVGYSKKKEYTLKCDSSCASADVSDINCDTLEGQYLTYDGGGYLSSSGVEFRNKEIAQCAFDHSLVNADYPNCDPGYIKKYEYSVFGVDTSFCSNAAYTTETACTTNSETWTVHTTCSYGSGLNTLGETADSLIVDCDGSANNCLAGPSLDHLEGAEYTSEITENKDLSSFTKSWTIDSPSSKGQGTNRFIANYSRIAGNTQVKPTNYYTTDITASNGLVGHEVETHTPAPNGTFDTTDPLEFYQKEVVDYNNDGNDDYIVYADHPFLGVTEFNSVARTTVMPYYGFYCLDKAKDVKAQIRLFVREWDRKFETDSVKMDYVSDVDDPSASTRLIDNNTYHDDDLPRNNIYDWDDYFDHVVRGKMFVNDQLGVLANDTNPGGCWGLDATKTDPALTLGTACVDDGTSEQWVTNPSGVTTGCYTLVNIDVLQTTKEDCDNAAGNYYWIWGVTNYHYFYNFPYASI